MDWLIALFIYLFIGVVTMLPAVLDAVDDDEDAYRNGKIIFEIVFGTVMVLIWPIPFITVLVEKHKEERQDYERRDY